MNSLGTILILGILAGGAAGPAGQTTPTQPLVRDGLILREVAGTLVHQSTEPQDSNDVWLFELSSDVNDPGLRRTGGSSAPSTGSGKTPSGPVLKAGTRLELLPSSTLERMAADIPRVSNLKSEISDSSRGAAPAYLLSGRVTKYKGRNFIFPDYFLPLQPQKSKAETADANTPDSSQVMALDEPNDVLALPPGFIEKLKAKRLDTRNPILDARRESGIQNQASTSTDAIFVDRTGYFVKQDKGKLAFALDAMGRNIEHAALRLLPCEALELAEREQAAQPEPVRFKVGGILTTYKGNNYLLLQKAIRTYSHGNFGG